MPIRNFLEMEPAIAPCHGGAGMARVVSVFDQELDTPLQFIHYTVLPAGASIGSHTHGNDEELYIILEGRGDIEVDGEKRAVKKGDVILNRPFGTHALYNPSDREELKILVFEVKKADVEKAPD